ncbi:hypothetical protein, partial [Undibacterium sp.]|uniref:hypothetical protein n=1 Tax=Undibacterium sp. TaxID=1914977 RepID=UPI003752D975
DKFFLEIQTISNQKLKLANSISRNAVALKVEELIPITYFKKFASLGYWNRNARCFEYTLPLTPLLRDSLFAAAKALGQSKKKISIDDIAARRAKIAESQGHLNMDFWECFEVLGEAYALEMLKARRLTDSPSGELSVYLSY